jgi:RNA polymerase sigma factor (sigma-70 family)
MTKEQLKQFRSIKQERDTLLELLTKLDMTISGIGSPSFEAMPHGNEVVSKVETQAIRRMELTARYEAKVAELTDALQRIETAIESLQPRERTLIRLYYIDGLTWEEVAVKMNYTWRHTHRIHSNALNRLKAQPD